MLRSSIGRAAAISFVAVVATAQDETMGERCEKEIRELHQFFEDWFNGKLENDETAFRRFDSVMAPDFEIIGPDGRSSSRSGIIQRLKSSHGFQAGADKPMGIWIENPKSRPLTDGFYLVTYEEWQEIEGTVRGRLSTAVFSESDAAPNGLVWHHVHETWLPEK